MQIAQMTPGQTQLAILLVSCAVIAWIYPDYTGIVIPLFVAITLYFSSDDMIISMFSIIPIDMTKITGVILKYKMYIMIALAVLAAYYANNLFSKKNGKMEQLTNSSDIFGSTVSSTRYSAPSPSPSDVDIMDMIKPKSSPKMSKKSIKKSGLDLDASM
jgi:hypothetical protein